MAHEPRRGSASGADIDAPSAQQPTLRSPAVKRGSSSDAAQLASDSKGEAQLAWSSGNAAETLLMELSDNAPRLTVGFYNVGIQCAEFGGKHWKQKEDRLASDLVNAFGTHKLDILCLCELGELGVGLSGKIQNGDINGWIRRLLAGSAVPAGDI